MSKIERLSSLLDEILFAKPGEMQEKYVPESQWNVHSTSKILRDAALRKTKPIRVSQYQYTPEDLAKLDKLSVKHTREREDAKVAGISEEGKAAMAQRHRAEREAVRPESSHTWTVPRIDKRALTKADIATNLYGEHDDYHARRHALLAEHAGQNERAKGQPDELLDSLHRSQARELAKLRSSYIKQVEHRPGYGTQQEINRAQIRSSILGTLKERRGALQALRRHVGSPLLSEPLPASELNKAGTGRIQVEGRAPAQVGEAPGIVHKGIAASHGKGAPFKVGGVEEPDLPKRLAEIAGDVKTATQQEIGRRAQQHQRLYNFIHQRAKQSLVNQAVVQKTPVLKGNALNDRAKQIVHPLFSPEAPEGTVRNKLAAHLGYSPEAIDRIHAHQRNLGIWKDTDKGYQTIRRQVEHAGKFFYPPPEPNVIKYPHLRKLGIGAGITAGVLGGAYGVERLITSRTQPKKIEERRQRSTERAANFNRLVKAFSSRFREIRFGYLDPIPRLRREADPHGREQGLGEEKAPPIFGHTATHHLHRARLAAARRDLPTFKDAGIAAGLFDRNISDQHARDQMDLHRSMIAQEIKTGRFYGQRSGRDMFGRGKRYGISIGRSQARELYNYGQKRAYRTVNQKLADVKAAIPGEVRAATRRGIKKGALIAGGVGITSGIVGGVAGGYGLKKRSEVKQFATREELRQKLALARQPSDQGPSPIHDIATGAVEGGLAYPVSEWAAHKIAGANPSIVRKMLAGGVVGGIATGLVGLGVSHILRAKRLLQARQAAQAPTSQPEEMSAKGKLIQFGFARRAAILGVGGATVGAGASLLRTPGREIKPGEDVTGKVLWRRSPIPFIRHYGAGIAPGTVAHIQTSSANNSLFKTESLERFAGGRRVFAQRTKRNLVGVDGRIIQHNKARQRFNIYNNNCEDAANGALGISKPNDQAREATAAAVTGGVAGIGTGALVPSAAKLIRKVKAHRFEHPAGIQFARVHNPFYRDEYHSLITAWNSATKGKKQLVPISKLVSHQPTVDTRVVKGYQKKPSSELPQVYKMGRGKFLIHDGNHRAVAKASGNQKIKVEVKKMVKPSKSVESIGFDAEGYNVTYPPPRGRRITVAQDRYRKQIREHEIHRHEANLLKSGLAGAALAASLRKSPLQGATYGVGIQTGLNIYDRRKKDVFGDAPLGVKRAEAVPAVAGALATVGVLGRKAYKLAQKVHGFAADDQGPGSPWYESRRYKGKRALLRRGGELRVGLRRATSLARDIRDVQKGQPLLDVRGRPRTPEWQKPWFTRGIAAGVLGTGIGATLLVRKHSEALSALSKHAGTLARKVPGVKPTEDFVRGVVGETKHAVKGVDARAKLKIEGLARDQRKAEAEAAEEAKRKALKEAMEKGTQMSSRLRSIKFAETVPDWDIRDQRGKSARIYAPGSQRRERRPKEWYERKSNQRLLWEAGLVASGVTGVGGTYGVTRLVGRRQDRPGGGGGPPISTRGWESNISKFPEPKYGWIKKFKFR